MKKEKDYTITVDVHVSKEEGINSKRWYFLKMYGHPITEEKESLKIDLSNMRDEQVLKVGKKLIDTIWQLVGENDKEYWSS